MYLCLRVDLDYVPWDTPDAADFGHGEPAVLLRLLDMGRQTGYKFHFFASNRSMHALPTIADSVLNEGHHLDWLCKHPEVFAERFGEAKELFASVGHHAIGFGLKEAWPTGVAFPNELEELQFISSQPGPVPPGLKHFVVETRSARSATRAGLSGRAWSEAVKAQLRECASRNRGITIVVRPQVLARIDPYLNHVKEILDLGVAVGSEPKTLRDVLNSL